MARINKVLAAAAGLVLATSAQSSSARPSVSGTVTQIFLPFADQQPLVASVVAQSGDVKTLAMTCAPGTDSSDCGFPEPFTFTAGPSTAHFQPSGIYEAIGEYDCKITGTSIAACALTAGLYTTVADDGFITTPAASSSTTRATLSGSDVVFIDVTITAGLKAGGASSASATGTSSGTSTRSTGASGSSSRASGTASSSAAATATGNIASHLSGVAALMLAAPLLLL